MISALLLLATAPTVLCSGTPWYPLMVPIHMGGHHHRHTTHVVTHPIVHTRVLVLGDDDHHHHHQHNHGHNHLHKHGHGHDHKHNHNHKHGHKHLHQQSSIHQLQHRKMQGRLSTNGAQDKPNPNYRFYKPIQKHEEDYDHDDHHGNHLPTKYDHDDQHGNHHSIQHDHDDHHGNHHPIQYDHDDHHGNHHPIKFEHDNQYVNDYPIKYSTPVHESPWKPILNYPKGYLPLKYLGIDEERVSAVVRHAMHEMDKKPIPLSPIGTKEYYRGAVYYENYNGAGRHVHTQPRYGAGRHVDTQPRYGAGSYGHNDYISGKESKTFKLNIECQCEEPSR